ncbi:hypothetical protein L7F22_043404 [Adiantum nelumboides]|nr:hypothetical protein [Adiantum nelumboides]
MGSDQRRRWPADMMGRVSLTLFALWAAYVAVTAAMQRRADMWPLLAALLASVACRLSLRRLFSTSPLFTNTLLSLLSSALIGFSALRIAWRQVSKQGWTHQVLMYDAWDGAHVLICCCSGFFAFDLLDLLRSRLHRPQNLLHHGILLICFNMALLRNVGINYLVFTLICEVHSSFAHLRSILRMVGLQQDGSLVVKATWGLHWMAFLTTRLLLHMIITIKIFWEASKSSLGIEWLLALSGMVGQDILNIMLGFDLYRAFLKDAYTKRRCEKNA